MRQRAQLTFDWLGALTWAVLGVAGYGCGDALLDTKAPDVPTSPPAASHPFPGGPDASEPGAEDHTEAGDGRPVDASGEGLCRGCTPDPGGESSDHGGTPTLCAAYSRPRAVSAADAEALGFDVARLQRVVARTLDAPVHWTMGQYASNSGYSATVGGYSTETRLQGEVSIAGYTYVALDSVQCDDDGWCGGPAPTSTSCDAGACDDREGAADAPGHHCTDRLELHLRADIRTTDGAIEAVAEGTGFARGLAGPGEPPRDPVGTVSADLTRAMGTLRVEPSGTGPHTASFMIDLHFRPDGIDGDQRIHVWTETGPVTAVEYLPLEASWQSRVP